MNVGSNRMKVVISSLLLPLGWYAGAAQAFLLSYYNTDDPIPSWESCSPPACTLSDYFYWDFESRQRFLSGFALNTIVGSGAGRWYRVDWETGDPVDVQMDLRVEKRFADSQTALTMAIVREPGQSLGRVPPATVPGGESNQYATKIVFAEDHLGNNITGGIGALFPETGDTYFPDAFDMIPVSHLFTATFSGVDEVDSAAGARFSFGGWKYSQAEGFSEGFWQRLFEPQPGDPLDERSLYIYLDFGVIDEAALTPPEVVTPVPSAVWLFGSGLLGFWTLARRDRSKEARGGPAV